MAQVVREAKKGKDETGIMWVQKLKVSESMLMI